MRSESLLVATLALGACTSTHGSFREVSSLTTAHAELQVERTDPGALGELHPEVAERLRDPLDADGAVSIALRQSPRLQARLSEVDLAVAELWQARPPNPEVEMEAVIGDGQSATLEMGAVMDLADLLRLPLQRRAAEASLGAAELQAAAAVLRYAFETRVAYYRYQADRALLELMRTASETFLAAWEAAAGMHEAGNLRALDVAQQRAAYERSRVDVAQAELRALMSREKLQVWLGLDGRATDWQARDGWTVPGDPPTTEGLEQLAVERNLVLEAQRETLLAWSRRVGVERMRGALPAAHAGLFAEREEGQWSFGPAAGLTIPVFDQNQGDIGRTRARLRIAQQELLQKAVQLRSLARRARAAWLNAAERVRFYDETLLPARLEVLDQTLLQYNAMNVGVFQLLQARRALVDTARERTEALFDLWRAHASVELLGAGGEPPEMDGPAMGTTPSNGGSDDGGH